MGDAPSNLVINHWKPASMAGDETCLVIGKRHAGKTTLMTDVMSHMEGKLDLCIGMNPTEVAEAPVLGKFLPSAFIYDHFNEAKLGQILEWQRRTRANGKAMRVGVIMDDCMGETTKNGKKLKVMSSAQVSKVFKIGRHRKIFFWATCQYVKDAPPDARSNADLVFLYQIPGKDDRRKVYDAWFGWLSKFDDFCKILDKCTEGYRCLVYDTRKAMRDPWSSISFYTAKPKVPPFRVGRPVFYTLSDHFYIDNQDTDMDVSAVLGADPLAARVRDTVVSASGLVISTAPEPDS